MKSHSMLWIAAGMALLSLSSFVMFWLYRPKVPLPPVLGQAPDFELTDENGNTFSSGEMVGKLWIVDFMFTNCPGPCPQMSAHMSQLNQAFKKYPDVAQISITVDPERDTPEVLKRYGKRMDAIWGSWHFLTGPASDIHQLSVSGFKIGDPESLIRHSTKFVLVDREGQIRGYFEGTDPLEMKNLRKTLKQFL